MVQRILCIVAIATCATGVAPAQDKLAEQKAAAKGNWKKVLDNDNPPHVETENLLVYGTVSGKELKDAAAALEKHLTAARMVKKAGGAAPAWLQQGFGRATVLQSLPKNEVAAEHGRAKVLVVNNKRTARDIYTGALGADESAVLRGSLIEYLAYSGKTK